MFGNLIDGSQNAVSLLVLEGKIPQKLIGDLKKAQVFSDPEITTKRVTFLS